MSDVTATPQMMAAAAGDLASVGSTIHTANANAAAGTAGVHPPGGDPVSAFVAALFAEQAQAYRTASAEANHFHNQFVQALRKSAGTYANAEAANVSHLEKVGGMVTASGKAFAGHLASNGAGTAHPGGMAPPVPGGAGGPGGGNPAGGGLGPSGADAHPAPAGGPQVANAGGGATGVPTGDGGAPVGAANGGVTGPGGAAAAGVPAAWGPVAPAAPTGPAMPHLATPPAAPPVIADGYPAPAGLVGPGPIALGGNSAAIGGLPEPVAPAASAAAASPAAAPPIPTAPKGQPLHQSSSAHQGDAAHPAAHTDHDKAAVPVPLLRLRIPSLRGFRRSMRSGLRDKEEWREELREAAESKPWGREELLGALGLRPPGNA